MDLNAEDLDLHTATAAWGSAADDSSPYRPDEDGGEGDSTSTSLPPQGDTAAAANAAHEAGEAAAAAATAQGATPAQADAARTAAMIEAMLGEEKVSLDPTLQIPIPSSDERVALAELQKGWLRRSDYTQKTQQLAEARRTLEARDAEVQRVYARMEARERALQEHAQRLQKAESDPEAYQRFIDHQQRLASDPDYKTMYERSMREMEREAIDQADEAIEYQRAMQAVREDVLDTAYQLSEKYEGVDPQRAVQVYGLRLQQKQAALKVGDLEQVFKDLAQERQTVVAPLQSEIETLRQQMEELKAAQKANAHNSRVRERAAPRRGTPAPVPTGSAASPTTRSDTSQGKRRGSLHSASQDWARG